MRRAGLPPRSSRACHIFNREGILRPLFFEEGVESSLGDGLVDLGFGTAGADTADGLAIDLDGQAALIGKVVRKSQGFHVALFHVVSGVFRGTPVEGRVPGLLLRPHDGIEGGGIGFLEEKQIAAFVHDANGDFDVAFLGLCLGGGDHGLDGRQVQVFFGGQVGGIDCQGKSERGKK